MECQSPRTPEEDIQTGDSEQLAEWLTDTPLAHRVASEPKQVKEQGAGGAGGQQRWQTGNMKGTGQR